MADELKPCSVDGCEKKRSDRLYCRMHRARLERTGRLDLKSTAERLTEKSVWDESIGCLEWSGHRNKHGYGRLRVGGRKVLAHRAAYAEWVGPIPDGMLVCHKCDNRSCINPEHLFVGTDKDNVQDAIRKDRIDPVQRAKERWEKCPTLRK